MLYTHERTESRDVASVSVCVRLRMQRIRMLIDARQFVTDARRRPANATMAI